MKEFPHIEIKDNLEEYNDQDLSFIAKELGIENYENLDRSTLISEINKKQTKGTINNILRSIDSLRPAGITGILVDFWFIAYKKNKWITSIFTVIFAVALTLTINYFDNKENEQLEIAKKESLDLRNRIADLDEVENSLENLISFIKIQKNAIIQTEQSLKELEKQKGELEPIVATQKETVEAIFREQEKRNWENRWIERLIGFGLGIAASIIVSIIFGLIKRIKATNNVYKK